MKAFTGVGASESRTFSTALECQVLSMVSEEENVCMRKTLAILALAGSFSAVTFAADREIKVDDRLDASADTLIDMMRAADKGIPQDLMDKAKWGVVMPGMEQ